jgi:hypothetical protein
MHKYMIIVYLKKAFRELSCIFARRRLFEKRMNRYKLTSSLRHPWIWFTRFRHCHGYGVHSPFAFNFIRYVINEDTPYYDYETLQSEEIKQNSSHDSHWLAESLKVRRLLFRLVNFVQPATIIDDGELTASSLYMRAGCRHAYYAGVQEIDEDLFVSFPFFVYFHSSRQPFEIENNFLFLCDKMSKESAVIIYGIGYSPAMQALWKRLIANKHVGISFDLYDMGILFFDTTLVKQNYIVNF